MPTGVSQHHSAFLNHSAANYFPKGDCPSVAHTKETRVGPCQFEQVGAAESGRLELRRQSRRCAGIEGGSWKGGF